MEECVEKGDIAACRTLCESGKEELQTLCYEERARQIEACVDSDTDCAAACTLWKDQGAEDVGGIAYRVKLGSDARVAKIVEKCGG